MGTDESGRMITIDFFIKDGDRPNSNIVIVGQPGGGKSYATKKILLNEYLNGCKIIIIDPEKEYKEMAKNIDNSRWIDCSGGYETKESNKKRKKIRVGRINPLQVASLPPIPVEEEDDSEEEEFFKSALSLHFHTLETFFKLYYPEMSTTENIILQKLLKELYAKFNIFWETDVSKFNNTDFPTMKDLYELILEKIKIEKTIELEVLSNIIWCMTEGADADMFNGYTTIETNSKFIVFDTYDLQNADDRIKKCQYFNILRFCQDMAFKDRKEKAYIVCDEAHLLVDPKVPQSMNFLRVFSKRARKYECGLIVITQDLIDFLDESVKKCAQTLFNTPSYKLFLGMDGENLKYAQQLWSLNAEESNILSSKRKGQGLLFVGSGRLFIKIVGQEFEKPFLTGGGR